ncbi:MAG: hypothetical protein KA821_10380 [Chitinophagaceae bacterium]|nr:hypothetical protein [Chitinophagaceae bacterium]
MINELNNDRPITSVEEDRFNRSAFAQKIASLCASRTPSSRVIGVYGKWGDGKSSLLNMVSALLDPDIIQVKFNPWIFKDESELLHEFFRLFANKLGGSVELKREKLQNAIADYGETIGVFGLFPQASPIITACKSLLNFFKKTNPISSEEAKKRVVELVINSKANITVFIDDIDRLDSREVGAVFKLVKLLADFPRTTYILSFDPDIVARMLAPNYGGNEMEFGYQYLEKVIQLPLTIPLAHEESVLDFLNNSLQQISVENKLNLDRESEKLAEYFVDGLLTLLDNPRKIIRFCNSLRFTIPILKGEANIFDIMVIEAFKVTAPELYHFIRSQKELMIDEYTNEGHDFDVKRKNAVQKINQAVKNYPYRYKEGLRLLTCHLFPYFAWQTPEEAKGFKKEQLDVSRRICTPEYFDRYFTFSLSSSEIPDTHFNSVYVVQNNLSESNIISRLKEDIDNYSLEKVAYKIASHRHSIKGEAAIRLAMILCKLSDQFEEAQHNFADSYRMMVITVEALIKGLPRERQFDFTYNAIEASSSLDFAADVAARFVMPLSGTNRAIFFPPDLAIQIKSAYLKKLKSRIAEVGFFNAVSENRMARQLVWWNDVNRSELTKQVDHVFLNIPEASVKFLRIFTPTVNSLDEKGVSKEVKSNFEEEQFMLLDQVIGAQKVLDNLKYSNFESLENYNWSRRPGLIEKIEDEEIVKMINFLNSLKKRDKGGI